MNPSLALPVNGEGSCVPPLTGGPQGGRLFVRPTSPLPALDLAVDAIDGAREALPRQHLLSGTSIGNYAEATRRRRTKPVPISTPPTSTATTTGMPPVFGKLVTVICIAGIFPQATYVLMLAAD